MKIVIPFLVAFVGMSVVASADATPQVQAAPTAAPPAFPNVIVTTPTGGETVVAGEKQYTVRFSIPSLDPSKLSIVHAAIELVQLGNVLGRTSSTAWPLQSNNTSIDVFPGHHLANGKDVVAPSGAGYSYRITIYEGQWEAHKVIAIGSSAGFTLNGPAQSGGSTSGPLRLAVSPDNMPAVIAEDGKTIAMDLKATNVEPSKNLKFSLELHRNGNKLGPIFNMGWSLHEGHNEIGATPGSYNEGSSGKIATPGPGYSYRIVVYEGTWGQSINVVGSVMTPTFAFGPRPALGPLGATFVEPAAGASLSRGNKSYVVKLTIKNVDPYEGRQFALELLHDGKLLGSASPAAWAADGTKTVQLEPGKYSASAGAGQPYKDIVAPAGSGYAYRVRFFTGVWGENPNIVASDTSPTFTLTQ